MNVLLFGATGMVGKGVLLECLDDPDVARVVSVVRRPSGMTHAKLDEVVHPDFFEYASIGDKLAGIDACFFCLGVSSAGMKEADYTRITYDLTMAAARALHEKSPNALFAYVSGASTDSSEKGSAMWARVKGKTENALIALFPKAAMFRPGYIHPMRGVTSSTRLYALLIPIMKPLYPIAKAIAPNAVTTSVNIGKAMIACAKKGAPKKILDPVDINALAAG